MPSSADKVTYEVNERVLAVNSGLMYEAKILKIDDKPQFAMDESRKGPYYYVHYKGWKSNWDEWVRHPQISKLDPAGLGKQKQLATTFKAKVKRAADDGKPLPRATMKPIKADLPAGRPTKRGRESTIDQDDEWKVRPEIKLSYPDAAKVQLVDDWEACTKENKIVSLPRNPHIEAILEAYEQEATTTFKPPRPANLIEELRTALLSFFRQSIDKNLLYPIERPQLDVLREKEPDRELSTVYGAEHLLRLFVNLPEIIAHSSMDPESVAFLRQTLEDFLQWLMAKQKSYCLDPLSQYEAAPQAWVDALDASPAP